MLCIWIPTLHRLRSCKSRFNTNSTELKPWRNGCSPGGNGSRRVCLTKQRHYWKKCWRLILQTKKRPPFNSKFEPKKQSANGACACSKRCKRLVDFGRSKIMKLALSCLPLYRKSFRMKMKSRDCSKQFRKIKPNNIVRRLWVALEIS